MFYIIKNVAFLVLLIGLLPSITSGNIAEVVQKYRSFQKNKLKCDIKEVIAKSPKNKEKGKYQLYFLKDKLRAVRFERKSSNTSMNEVLEYYFLDQKLYLFFCHQKWKNKRYFLRILYSSNGKPIHAEENSRYLPNSNYAVNLWSSHILKTSKKLYGKLNPYKNPAPYESSIVSSHTSSIPSAFYKTTYRCKSNVYLREGPSTKYKAIRLLKRGETVTKVGQFDKWYNVTSIEGKKGYVIGTYLD